MVAKAAYPLSPAGRRNSRHGQRWLRMQAFQPAGPTYWLRIQFSIAAFCNRRHAAGWRETAPSAAAIQLSRWYRRVASA